MFNFPAGFHLVLISYSSTSQQAFCGLHWSLDAKSLQFVALWNLWEVNRERKCPPRHLFLSQLLIPRLLVLLFKSCFIQHVPYSWLLPSLTLPSACPLSLVCLLPESARRFGSIAVNLRALDFYPPCPFSQLLDPIQFPRVLLVIVELSCPCWWMSLCPSILC